MVDNILLSYGAEIHPTGSNYICNPPVTDTDKDYIVYVSRDKYDSMIDDMLELDECSFEGSDISPAEQCEFGYRWNSLRVDNINYIVTCDKEFYNNFVNATTLAKSLNLLKKEDRITLFQAILYGCFETYEDTFNYE